MIVRFDNSALASIIAFISSSFDGSLQVIVPAHSRLYSKIVFVDGEMFSWYGSRLKIAPSYFQLLFEKMIS